MKHLPIAKLTCSCRAVDESFDYMKAWYPVGFTSDLDKSKLHRFTLLNQHLCIWWSSEKPQGWVAVKDECPHRLVPLSEGRVNLEGQLECGYHGWSFNAQGSCTRIPQMSLGSPQLAAALGSPRSCLERYAAEVKQGLLFVNATPLKDGYVTDASDIITVPELDDPDEWISSDTWRDLPYDWYLLMENVLDSSHVSFTHHKSMSDRNAIGRYDDIHLTEKVGPSGFKAVWPTGPRGGRLGPQKTEWRPPGFLKHHLETKSSDSLVIVYATPQSPGRCRLINRNVVRLKAKSPYMSVVKGIVRSLTSGWRSHVTSHTLLEDDQIFLHLGEIEVAKKMAETKMLMGKVHYNPSPADACVSAFHRFLSRFGGPFGDIGDPGYVAKLGPRLDRNTLLDRYSQHTASCKTCLNAMQWFEKLSHVLQLGSAFFLLLAAACLTNCLGLSAGLYITTTPPSPYEVGSVAQILANIVFGLSSTGWSSSALGLRGTIWGLIALAVLGLKNLSDKAISSFKIGPYPPPRNLAKDK